MYLLWFSFIFGYLFIYLLIYFAIQEERNGVVIFHKKSGV